METHFGSLLVLSRVEQIAIVTRFQRLEIRIILKIDSVEKTGVTCSTLYQAKLFNYLQHVTSFL